MLILEVGDKLQGDASVAAEVDYTVHGLVGTALTQIADGQLADTKTDIYTAGAIVVLSSLTLVNTGVAARTVNLYLLPSGGTARRIFSKDFTLGIGYSLHYDGVKVYIINPSGAEVAAYVDHAISHTDGSDDIQNATAAQKGLATVAQITKLDGIEAGAEVNNISDINATDLTDGGDTTLHDHDGISENTAARHTQGTDVALGAVSPKNPPIDADKVIYRDSIAADALVTSTWAQVKAFLKTYFDTLYNLYVHPNHSGDVTSVADGAQTIVNKQTLSATAPITVSNTPVVIAAGAPVITIPAATAAVNGYATAAQITKLDGIAAGANVTSTANLTDNALVRGDGGAKGVQTSTVLVDDSGRMTNPSQPAFLGTVNCTALTGGTAGALDSYAVAGLVEGDRAIVAVGGEMLYFMFDADGTNAENVATHPYYVRPNDYVTAGVWIEQPPAGGDKEFILNLIYPIGTIYTEITGINPGTTFGIGTWVAFGAGRVPVGFDAAQTEFDAVEETGGAKTHVLTEAELAVHTHIQNAHAHTKTTNAAGSVSTKVQIGGPDTTNDAFTTDSTTAINQNAGSGTAHNNLQPYIVVYMWKRTA